MIMNNNELKVLDSAVFDEPLWVLAGMVCDNIETVEEFCSILVKLTNSGCLTCKSDDLLDPPITDGFIPSGENSSVIVIFTINLTE